MFLSVIGLAHTHAHLHINIIVSCRALSEQNERSITKAIGTQRRKQNHFIMWTSHIINLQAKIEKGQRSIHS